MRDPMTDDHWVDPPEGREGMCPHCEHNEDGFDEENPENALCDDCAKEENEARKVDAHMERDI